MESSLNSRQRRNVSLSFLYLGKEHKFVKAKLSVDSGDFSGQSSQKVEHKRNFFNSPTPHCKSDNDSK